MTALPGLTPEDLADVETLLPPIVRTLVQVLGFDAACGLVREVGGTTLVVPVVRTRAGEASHAYLAEAVGQEAADKLVQRFGGEAIYIPRCHAAVTEMRYRKIRRDFDRMTGATGGMSGNHAVGVLARRYGYSDRHVWSVLKMLDRVGGSSGQVDPRQGDFWG